MLWSAGLEAPRHVWVHGWMLTGGGERMSKSRGNFLDPNDVVAALGADGARYATLREVAFDRDTDVSWDSFVRRYNADLANDFGNLVNRTVSMANRYLEGERPAPARTAAGGWRPVAQAFDGKLAAFLLHDALAVLWDFVGDGQSSRWTSRSPGNSTSSRRPATRRRRGSAKRGVLGDLIEACRLIALAAAPFMPNTAPRVLTQLGYDYPYGADGNGGPPLADELTLGRASGRSRAGRRGRAALSTPRRRSPHRVSALGGR